MKTKYIFNKVRNLAKAVLPFYLFTLLPLATACSPEEFSGADANGKPTMNGVDIQLSVDQETNQALYSVASLPMGTYPIWIVDGASYSTLQAGGYSNTEAGSHTVELKLGNRNGFSDASVSKTFTFNETKIDWSADFRRITGKEWRIDNKEPGHMGCGPAGTAGTEWWSAAPDDKKDFGVYDDRISFTADNAKGGTYTYNPGEDGMTYVNTGTTKWSGNPGADWDVAIGAQTAGWHFEKGNWKDSNGEVISVTYIVLDDNTAFPYISSDGQYEHPRFRVESLTNNKMVLVYEAPDGSIAWHFILTSKEGEKEFEGFDANSQYNMWKGITPTATFHFQPGWADVRTAEMEATYVGGDNSYSVTVPDACQDRWQAQMHLHTDLNTTAASNYDFSCILSADVDIDGVTIKLTDEADANAIIDVDNVSLKKGEDFVFWKSDLAGVDLAKVKLVFDFGRAAGKTTVEIRNIVLKDHANDDGTVLPNVDPTNPDQPTMDWDYNSGANLWKAVDDGTLFEAFGYWFADDNWSEIAHPECAHSGDAYELTLPAGMGGSQWQGQFHIDTKLTASAAKKYNFYLVMEADNDCPGVTFKLTDSGDSNFFIEERNDVKADVPFVLKREGVSLKEGTDASAIRLFFDFGGSPAGTNIKISKIYFEEAVTLAYEDENNLWRAVDEGSMFNTFGYWFADDNWSEIAHPECAHSGNAYELTLPVGMGGSQWQGQFHIDTNLSASAAKSYNFQLTFEADNDCPGVTIKFTDSGDTNFFCEGRHDIKADEPYVFTLKGATLKEGVDGTGLRLFFDFGGSPAGTKVKISKIIFEESN